MILSFFLGCLVFMCLILAPYLLIISIEINRRLGPRTWSDPRSPAWQLRRHALELLFFGIGKEELPSGNLLHSYGQSSFLMGKLIIYK